MIELKNVSKGFGGTWVHQGLDMEIPQGIRLCLVGGSGVGKSLLMKLILGLEKLDEGEIYFEGKAVSQMDELEGLELMEKCGVVFQNAALFDSLTVRENIGLRLDENPDIETGEVDQLTKETLKKVQLEESIISLLPSQLSGGMQKRVAIARAVIHNPSYLFYDEPTTGLDPENAAYIDDLILHLGLDQSKTSVIITHDLETIARVATDVAMLSKEGLIFYGKAEDFWQSELPAVKTFLKRKRQQ